MGIQGFEWIILLVFLVIPLVGLFIQYLIIKAAVKAALEETQSTGGWIGAIIRDAVKDSLRQYDFEKLQPQQQAMGQPVQQAPVQQPGTWQQQ